MENDPSRLRPNIETAIMESLKRRIPTDTPSAYLEDIVSLLMDALSKGEVYVGLNEAVSIELKKDGWPSRHIEELKKSSWINGKHSPIILTNNDISWRRWHNKMQAILMDLKERSLQCPVHFTQKNLLSNNYNYPSLNPQQLSAIEGITQQNLILISGGPGTGKTSTIVEILIKALSLKEGLRIGLAAPTGKASRRLKETIGKSINNREQVHQEILSKIPCLTIHRWLQAIDGGFKRCKANQLQLDLLVVDEMSMVDIHLMSGLLTALPKETQLILVGDPLQLPPIGEGPVWHTIQTHDSQHSFSKCSFHLTKLYRNRGDIASLANILRVQDINGFFSEVMRLPSSSNVNVLVRKTDKIPSEIIHIIKQHQNSILELIHQAKYNSLSKDIKGGLQNEATIFEKLLEYQERLMVLCPRRYGPWSIEEINKEILGIRIEEGFHGWPEGTPVICGENQPELNLSNGDIGILIGNRDGKRLIFKSDSTTSGSNQHFIHPARVRKLEPAYALTIHKSQGSESNHVICLWPEPINNKLDNKIQNKNQEYEKKLIYTAITRARTKLDLTLSIEK